MNKEQFWQIIDTARKTAGGWKSMYDPLLEALAKLDALDIIRWDQIFDQYRILAYKDKIWAAAAVMHEGCSKDGFEAFLGWLIAQGKEVYFKALENPDSLAEVDAVKVFGREVFDSEEIPEGAYFETILYIASNAYGNKPGQYNFYNQLLINPLSDQEKAEMADGIHYAEDIDANDWSRCDSWGEISKKLSVLLPNLYKLFNTKQIKNGEEL